MIDKSTSKRSTVGNRKTPYVTVLLNESERASLESIAANEDRSMSAVARRALRQYIASQKPAGK